MNPKREEKIKFLIAALGAAKDDAKAHGLGRGHGGTGSVKCPSCENGTIRYSVAGVNGHMHACRTTKGCVAWME
jgi:ribosomal protein S27E